MAKITEPVPSRRCPKCAGTEVRRSPRRGFYELVLLSCISMRPFRCQGCSNRFYRFSFNGRASSSSSSLERDLHPRSETLLPVLIYGYGADKQPFREDTRMRLADMQSGEFSLATPVAKGQKLILIGSSDDIQRCRVISVGAQIDGKRIIGIRFRGSIWEFWSLSASSSSK
jgi:hypothetical protein